MGSILLFTLVLLGAWILYKILTSEMAVPFMIIVLGVALVMIAISVHFFGDKDGDGVGDTQYLEVVHPVGDDPALDQEYSDINEQNVKTNTWIMFDSAILSAIILVSVVVMTGCFVVVYYTTRSTNRK
jgi:hypothetical protein